MIVSFLSGSHPGRSEALRLRFLNPSTMEGIDALLVIGNGKSEDQLLLLRYFLPEPIFQDGNFMFQELMAHSKGWVARRTGGSAGPAALNRDFFDFLSLPGTIPRKTHGSIIIKTETQYFIYYCTPYEVDRTVKCVHYWQPHRGGKCNTFSSTFIEKHSELRCFASSKIATAYLLKSMEPQYCIAQEAVSVELAKIQSSVNKGGVFGSNAFFDEYIRNHCDHTIVCHPVGYHHDVFGNGSTNFMENRIVLYYKQYSRNVDYPLGRGGCGNGKYAWAFLDW